MSRKKKLCYRTVLSLLLSAVLFGAPIGAFFLNGGNVVEVRAEEAKEENAGTTGADTGPACICEEKCSSQGSGQGCPVCSSDHKACRYKTPRVSIRINRPDGWYNDTAKVSFTVSDIACTGNFQVSNIQAKIGQNGSWTDVTEEQELEISEDCTVYVLVTDQKGNTYERSRAVRCFDTTKPTLNAAVSGGLLSIQVHDADSGAKAVYVNGYEFTELTNGALNIRLQQFDAGYEYFAISAMDNAGNLSETYQVKNPYHKDPADGSDENPAAQLVQSAEATKPGSATGTVTEHTKTDSSGNAIMQGTGKQDVPGASDAGQEEEPGLGKEFYTIRTGSDKVFYLVIDRDGEDETVYFLTEITENDLLNVTSEHTETLPQNSAVLGSAIPASGSALPSNNGNIPDGAGQAEDNISEMGNTGEMENAGDMESVGDTEDAEDTESGEKSRTPAASYILMGAAAAALTGGAYYFKVARKKKERFLEDEDDEEEEEEEEDTEGYGDEEEEAEDDFFGRDEG